MRLCLCEDGQQDDCSNKQILVYWELTQLKYEFQPIAMILAKKRRYCKGMSEKLMTWTAGQTIQLAFSAGHQVLSMRSFTLLPSMVAMLLRNTPIMTGAKPSWSQATRARTSAFLLFLTLTLRARNANHVVATGPKTTIKSQCLPTGRALELREDSQPP